MSLYWDTLVRTLGIAEWVVVICGVMGYPAALLIYRSKGVAKTMLTGAIILPYFVAVLIRTYALMVLLGRNGPINKLLLSLGLIDSPLGLLFNRGTVLLDIAAVLMPLMVLTIYSGFSRIDPAVLRGGRSARAGPVAVFWRVFFPLSLPAVGAGGLLVFVATLGFFITPTLLGSTGDQMFAMHITHQSEFIESQGFLQALAVVLLVIASLVVGLAIRFMGLEFIWGVRSLSRVQNTSIMGAPSFSVYSATKAAVRNLVRSWILDLKGRGIRINTISPGPIHTPGLVGLAGPDAAAQQGLLDYLATQSRLVALANRKRSARSSNSSPPTIRVSSTVPKYSWMVDSRRSSVSMHGTGCVATRR